MSKSLRDCDAHDRYQAQSCRSGAVLASANAHWLSFDQSREALLGQRNEGGGWLRICQGSRSSNPTERTNAARSSRTCPHTRNGLLFLVSGARETIQSSVAPRTDSQVQHPDLGERPTFGRNGAAAITRLSRALAAAARKHATRQGMSFTDLVGLLLSREVAASLQRPGGSIA